MCSTLVVLLIIPVLQIWVCCEYSCQAGAIRIHPGNGEAKVTKEGSRGSLDKKNKEELLRKYFNGRTFGFNRTANGFEESKRRVPSCPDPLHN
ncbi:CLAVATA3/ESR (CLE)-related protein 43 [Morella rubra]|uniref:CLAVATA3/ESR (CLE)-related protein 43 n=1 Tax=Morella rubra TaxID=262757 RepID=A0A6A1W705_9ROSI|nr:CLAVATA3/ESR (CLE)-related protein 43 [Morella rubra]